MDTKNYFENVWKSNSILIKKSQKSVLNSLQKLQSFLICVSKIGALVRLPFKRRSNVKTKGLEEVGKRIFLWL